MCDWDTGLLGGALAAMRRGGGASRMGESNKRTLQEHAAQGKRCTNDGKGKQGKQTKRTNLYSIYTVA